MLFLPQGGGQAVPSATGTRRARLTDRQFRPQGRLAALSQGPLFTLYARERPVRPRAERDAEARDRGGEHVLAVARRVHPALGDRGRIGVVPPAVLHPAGIDVMTDPAVALQCVVLAGPGREIEVRFGHRMQAGPERRWLQIAAKP